MRVREARLKPCPLRIDYDGMTPIDGARRRCDGCGEVVTDLSALDEDEARAHVARGSSCVRYVYDRAGNIVHRRHLLLAATVAAAPLLVACPGAVGGDFGDAGPVDSGAQPRIRASDYDRSCEVDDECIPIHEGDPCCEPVCASTSINQKEQQHYGNDVVEQKKLCEGTHLCGGETCSYALRCISHVCTLVPCSTPASCQPPPDAGRDAALDAASDAADQ